MSEPNYARLKAEADALRAEAATPPAVTTPIDATKTDTQVVLRQIALQAIIAVGFLITALGLAESSWIVQLYRFVLTENGAVFVGIAVTILGSGYDLYRKVRKNRQVQVLSLLPSTPDSVAIGPENPSAPVERAVAVATKALRNTGDRL